MVAAISGLTVWNPPPERRLTLVSPPIDEKRPLRAALPPPPPPETLQGIGEGIHAIQLQQSRDSRKLDELGQNVADINATVTVHGREIRQLRDAVDEHHERLVDLERLPRARPPHPSMVDKYDPDQTPGGGIRIEPHMWSGIQKVLSDLREQVEAGDQARTIEVARAEAAEKREIEIEADRERDAHEWDRRLKRLGMIGTAVAAGLSALAYMATHFLHL